MNGLVAWAQVRLNHLYSFLVIIFCGILSLLLDFTVISQNGMAPNDISCALLLGEACICTLSNVTTLCTSSQRLSSEDLSRHFANMNVQVLPTGLQGFLSPIIQMEKEKWAVTFQEHTRNQDLCQNQKRNPGFLTLCLCLHHGTSSLVLQI